MRVEILVLGRDGSRNEIGRHFVELHVGAPPGVGVEDFIEDIAIPVANARRLECGSFALQVFDTRQMADGLGILVHAERDQHAGDGGQHKRANQRQAHETAEGFLPVDGGWRLADRLLETRRRRAIDGNGLASRRIGLPALGSLRRGARHRLAGRDRALPAGWLAPPRGGVGTAQRRHVRGCWQGIL